MQTSKISQSQFISNRVFIVLDARLCHHNGEQNYVAEIHVHFVPCTVAQLNINCRKSFSPNFIVNFVIKRLNPSVHVVIG